MATVNIRRLPDDIHRRLRMRAAKAGRSMEAEARLIIEAACQQEPGQAAAGVEALQRWVEGLYDGRKPGRVVESLLEERRREARKER